MNIAKLIFSKSAISRKIARTLLSKWRRTGRKFGYYYIFIEKYGAMLAEPIPLQATLPNGLFMQCDVRDHVQRQLYFHGLYEPIEACLFTRVIQNGWTVFDIGANVGQYSLLASSKVGPTGQVHAFEPIPTNFDRFAANLQNNNLKNVVLNKNAAWDREMDIALGLTEIAKGNNGSFSAGSGIHSSTQSVQAKAISIDNYIEQNSISRLDLLKMDIEGSELKAIKGLLKSLKRWKPMMLIEVNREALQGVGSTPEELFDLLTDELGYSAWMIGQSSRNWQKTLDPSRITQENYLFCANGLPDELLQEWDIQSCLKWAISGN